LVRNGQSVKLRPDKEGNAMHTAWRVYREMLLQICRDYRTLPDVRTLSTDEIEFFYNGIRGELEDRTKPVESRR